MRKWVYRTFKVILLFTLVVIWIYHRGTMPARLAIATTPAIPGRFINREVSGIHQLILEGTAYNRGLESGRLTGDLIFRQEKILNAKLLEIFHWPVLIKALNLGAMIWFQGIEEYFEPWMLDEIYGVAQSGSAELNSIADPYTRQVAYHGLHEVGQMLVDRTGSDVGCTAFAIPVKGNWVVGRNFDFESDPIFDDEKIMKWVFPEQGIPYLSIIFAGMVGVVTGVNAEGLYVSINAAGSKDFARVGTPSTLVLLKVLMQARTGAEAIRILRESQVFITDMFLIHDSRRGEVFRVEKSPKATEVTQLKEPSVIANHLSSPRWKNDSPNEFRRLELTSGTRERRGLALLETLKGSQNLSSQSAVEFVVRSLRDKRDADGSPLPLGHRRAIDSLIAVHSVVFDGDKQILWVNRGPGAAGPYLAVDLKASFQNRTPVFLAQLPADETVPEGATRRIRRGEQMTAESRRLAKRGDCDQAAELLEKIPPEFKENYLYSWAQGDAENCAGRLITAKKFWQTALDGRPAYAAESQWLQRHLQ
jgi:isopenicillin-N N-acyltransferase like protein